MSHNAPVQEMVQGTRDFNSSYCMIYIDLSIQNMTVETFIFLFMYSMILYCVEDEGTDNFIIKQFEL